MCVCIFIFFSSVWVASQLCIDEVDFGIGKKAYHGCKLWVIILANVKITTAPSCWDGEKQGMLVGAELGNKCARSVGFESDCLRSNVDSIIYWLWD